MMGQDTNKEYLRKLLDFLQSRILSNSANQWFAKDLYKLLAPISDARISDIYEQCIETILAQQANDFYKDFVISDIRPQLISDFIKMEHWRRRNNIQEFCLALYQQIEAIVNFLGRDESLNLIWRSIRNAGFFVNLEAKDIRVRGNGKSIEQSIIYKPEIYRTRPELRELVAMDKYKAILFLIVYQTNVHWNNKSFFNDDFFTGQSIYQVRNLNHRGILTELSTSNRLYNIIYNPTHSMCHLLGLYSRFVSGINKGFPISKELIELEACCRMENVTNQL